MLLLFEEACVAVHRLMTMQAAAVWLHSCPNTRDDSMAVTQQIVQPHLTPLASAAELVMGSINLWLHSAMVAVQCNACCVESYLLQLMLTACTP